jgi:hypothetical protein
MNETIDERLKRLNAEMDEMLKTIPHESEGDPKETLRELLNFGFTLREAKAWLKKEPNYVSRRKVTWENNSQRGNRTFLKCL